jgi:hypothetical protein
MTTVKRDIDQNQPRIDADAHSLWLGAFGSDHWQPFKRAWIARGLWRPPTPGQTEVLREVARAKPQELGQWVDECPGRGDSHAVVAYVLERWHAATEQPKRDDDEAARASRDLQRVAHLLADRFIETAAHAAQPATFTASGEAALAGSDQGHEGRSGGPCAPPPSSQPLSHRPAHLPDCGTVCHDGGCACACHHDAWLLMQRIDNGATVVSRPLMVYPREEMARQALRQKAAAEGMDTHEPLKDGAPYARDDAGVTWLSVLHTRYQEAWDTMMRDD